MLGATMVSDGDFMITSLSFALALIGCFVMLRSRRREHAMRMAELSLANHALDTALENSAIVLDDPASPPHLRDFLEKLRNRVGRADFAKGIYHGRISPTSPRNEALVEKLVGEIEGLRKHRPDLAKAAVVAMTTSMVATDLRWPVDEYPLLKVIALEQDAITRGDTAMVRKSAQRLLPNLQIPMPVGVLAPAG